MIAAGVSATLLAADARRNPRGRSDESAAPPALKGKSYSFNSRFYRVTSDLPDRPLAIDIAKHMDAVYAEYSSRMASFRPNPNAAVLPDGRMNLYVIKTQQTYLDLVADFGFSAANSGGVFFRSPNASGLRPPVFQASA